MAQATGLAHEVVRRDGPQDRLLLLMHGYGQDPAELGDRLDLLDPEGRWLAVLPLGPHRKKDRAIWYRALSGDSPEPEAQYLASLALVDDLVDHLCAGHGLAREEAVVGGFSQGAGLALGLLVQDSTRPRPAGVVSLCGFLPLLPRLRVDLPAAAGRPVLFVAGDADHYFSPGVNQQMAEALEGCGLAVTYRPVATGHEVTDEVAGLVAPWLAGVAGGAVPAEALGAGAVEGPNVVAAELARLWHPRVG